MLLPPVGIKPSGGGASGLASSPLWHSSKLPSGASMLLPPVGAKPSGSGTIGVRPSSPEPKPNHAQSNPTKPPPQKLFRVLHQDSADWIDPQTKEIKPPHKFKRGDFTDHKGDSYYAFTSAADAINYGGDFNHYNKDGHVKVATMTFSPPAGTKTKVFGEKDTHEWAQFVHQNYYGKIRDKPQYDVVQGPVSNNPGQRGFTPLEDSDYYRKRRPFEQVAINNDDLLENLSVESVQSVKVPTKVQYGAVTSSDQAYIDKCNGADGMMCNIQ